RRVPGLLEGGPQRLGTPRGRRGTGGVAARRLGHRVRPQRLVLRTDRVPGFEQPLLVLVVADDALEDAAGAVLVGDPVAVVVVGGDERVDRVRVVPEPPG